MTGTPTGAGGSRKQTTVIDAGCQKVVITIEVDGTCDPGTTGTAAGATAGTTTPAAKGPTATPYLIIPAGAGDTGTRPLAGDQALQSRSIQAAIANPQAAGGWNEFQIQLSCTVQNLGTAPSSAALAEFYVGTSIGIWNPSHATLTPAQVQAATQLVGRTTFTASAGATTTVTCPTMWTPGDAQSAQQGVLVQVSDLFTDPIAMRFDALNDRHVARADDVMDPIIS